MATGHISGSPSRHRGSYTTPSCEALEGGGGEADSRVHSPAAPPRYGRSSSVGSHNVSRENSRLQEDNNRLWQCVALLRNDNTIGCQEAINVVFGSFNTISDRHSRPERRGLGIDFRDAILVDNLKFREENKRLHAVLWLLRDNPTLQADSTLAAVFRLNDEQFRSKFKFDYENLGQGLSKMAQSHIHQNNNKASGSASGYGYTPSPRFVGARESSSHVKGHRRSRSASGRRPRWQAKSCARNNHRSCTTVSHANLSANRAVVSDVGAQDEEEDKSHLVDLLATHDCQLKPPLPTAEGPSMSPLVAPGEPPCRVYSPRKSNLWSVVVTPFSDDD